MTGETNLNKMLRGLSPQLNDGQYVFVTVNDATTIDRKLTLAEFKEAEGTTLVLEKAHADALEIKYDYVSAWITLTVHSSLAAVGLTAAFANALAAKNISCNVIAGYYHDHLFVAHDDADKAMQALQHLAQNA